MSTGDTPAMSAGGTPAMSTGRRYYSYDNFYQLLQIKHHLFKT
jgi:DNA-binding transcriptional MerR regulator